MAYGQTSSGKTFTMDGTLEKPGVSHNTINRIFELMRAMDNEKRQLDIAMLEIYNEQIRDLLEDSKAEDSNSKLNGFNLETLHWKSCSSMNDVKRLHEQGRNARATAATDLNLHSSRSHLIQLVRCIDGGMLYLVDLAGSENVQKSNVSGKDI